MKHPFFIDAAVPKRLLAWFPPNRFGADPGHLPPLPVPRPGFPALRMGLTFAERSCPHRRQGHAVPGDATI